MLNPAEPQTGRVATVRTLTPVHTSAQLFKPALRKLSRRLSGCPWLWASSSLPTESPAALLAQSLQRCSLSCCHPQLLSCLAFTLAPKLMWVIASHSLVWDRTLNLFSDLEMICPSISCGEQEGEGLPFYR